MVNTLEEAEISQDDTICDVLELESSEENLGIAIHYGSNNRNSWEEYVEEGKEANKEQREALQNIRNQIKPKNAPDTKL